MRACHGQDGVWIASGTAEPPNQSRRRTALLGASLAQPLFRASVRCVLVCGFTLLFAGAMLVLFLTSLAETVVCWLDALKTAYRVSVALPLGLLLSAASTLLCLPLAPQQALVGYCLGTPLGFLVNLAGVAAGLGGCVVVLLPRRARWCVERLHPRLVRIASEQRLLVAFLLVFSPGVNLGTAVYVLAPSGLVLFLVVAFFGATPWCFFYAYLGAMVDAFATTGDGGAAAGDVVVFALIALIMALSAIAAGVGLKWVVRDVERRRRRDERWLRDAELEMDAVGSEEDPTEDGG